MRITAAGGMLAGSEAGAPRASRREAEFLQARVPTAGTTRCRSSVRAGARQQAAPPEPESEWVVYLEL